MFIILTFSKFNVFCADHANIIVSSSFTIPNMFNSYKRKEQKISSSDFPKNSAIITFANEYHWGLVMRLIANLEADVQSNIIVVTMDSVSFKYCEKLTHVDCVMGAHDVPASDFLRSSYVAITYFKWRIARDAIKIFDYVFILDADLVMVKNPWLAIKPKINQYDTWYQKGKIVGNSGQLLFRASAATARYIDYVIYMETIEASRVEVAQAAKIKHSPLRLDQDNIPEAIKNSSVTYSELPTVFVGHCVGSKELILDITTYHACGISGREKVQVLENFQNLYVKALSNHSWNLSIDQLKGFLVP